MKNKNAILLALVLILVILPLFMRSTGDAKKTFTGTDQQAEAAIVATHPDYQPWFRPLWEPPSGEIESLLFSLQAAIGAGILGYYLGYKRGQSQRRRQDRLDAGD